jgi:hypothetical membrane protein
VFRRSWDENWRNEENEKCGEFLKIHRIFNESHYFVGVDGVFGHWVSVQLTTTVRAIVSAGSYFFFAIGAFHVRFPPYVFLFLGRFLSIFLSNCPAMMNF